MEIIKNRPSKGNYEYLNWQKKFTMTRTINYFAIVIAILVIGIVTTGNRNNIMTVVAVVGALPASKSLVNTLMYWRYKSISDETHEKLLAFEDDVHILYNMLISSNEKINFIDCIVIFDNTVYLLATVEKIKGNDMEKYIKNVLSNNGKGNVNVKLYKKEKELINRLKAVKENKIDNETTAKNLENKIIQIIGSLSL